MPSVSAVHVETSGKFKVAPKSGADGRPSTKNYKQGSTTSIKKSKKKKKR